MRNEFIYRKTLALYENKTELECMVAANEIVQELKKRCNHLGTAPSNEEIDRYSSVLDALRDLINKKGKTPHEE